MALGVVVALVVEARDGWHVDVLVEASSLAWRNLFCPPWWLARASVSMACSSYWRVVSSRARDGWICGGPKPDARTWVDPIPSYLACPLSQLGYQQDERGCKLEKGLGGKTNKFGEVWATCCTSSSQWWLYRQWGHEGHRYGVGSWQWSQRWLKEGSWSWSLCWSSQRWLRRCKQQLQTKEPKQTQVFCLQLGKGKASQRWLSTSQWWLSTSQWWLSKSQWWLSKGPQPSAS